MPIPAGSHEAVRAALDAALEALAVAEGRDGYQAAWPVAIYDDRVVVREHGQPERLTQYPYTIAEGRATLGAPVAVEATFRPVASETMTEAARLHLVEAEAGAPERWRVCVIRAGLSANGVHYPAEVLRAAVARVEGAPVLARSDEEHVTARGGDVRALVGQLRGACYVEAGGGAIEADLRLLDPGMAARLREAYAQQMLGEAAERPILGLSIVADGPGRAAYVEGRSILIVESIDRVDSVDLVTRPAAGGAILRLVEAIRTRHEDPDMALRQRMIETIRTRLGEARLRAIDVADDEALEGAYREAVAAPDAPRTGPQAGGTPAGAGTPPAPAGHTGDVLLHPPAAGEPVRLSEAIRRLDARLDARDARDAIAASGLPAPAVERLQARLREGQIAPGAVDGAIRTEREYLAQIAPGAHVTGLGDGGDGRIEAGADAADRMRERVDALFDPAASGPRSIRSLYQDLTGDRHVTGRLAECDLRRLREAVHVLPARLRETIQIGTGNNAGVLAEIFGDSIARRMIAEYRDSGVWMWWERLVHVTDAPDFRSQHRIRWGGYDDLPVVAQGAEYTTLPSPTDVEETYTVTKRGGTEDITLEAIANDDMSQIGLIPARLARAARRTVSAHLSAIYTAASGSGPDMVSGHALFSSHHANHTTDALSAAAVAAARVAMWQQPEQDTTRVLGVMPRYLLVPIELQQTAEDLFVRAANNDPNFVQRLSYDVVPVPDWTDPTDWVLQADYRDCPTIEIGFLQGRREPEIFLQNMETVGSLFSSDKWTYKIRHVYGSTALDWRGMYKGVVAG